MTLTNFIRAFFIGLTLSLTTTLMAAETIKLEGGFFDKTDGTARVDEGENGQKKVTIELSGLKPNALYTVWLVNEKPEMSMSGLGTEDYSFKSDSEGKATYTANVDADELTKWQIIKIAFHPDDNPKNMDNIKSAATGKIKEAQRTAE